MGVMGNHNNCNLSLVLDRWSVQYCGTDHLSWNHIQAKPDKTPATMDNDICLGAHVHHHICHRKTAGLATIRALGILGLRIPEMEPTGSECGSIIG